MLSAVCAERGPSREHFVEHRTNREQIGTRIRALSAEQLGGEVPRRAHERLARQARDRLARALDRVEGPGKTEVQ
jgi:hypothetical protein